jgi:Cu-processing system permease protein
MGAFTALALNGFREARRNRVTVVITAFIVGLLLFSSLLTNLSVSTFDRVLTDVGIGSMTLLLVMLTVFLSSGLLAREIERRTIFLVVSKPVSRTTFLLARYAGTMLTLGVLLAVMGLVFLGLVSVYGTTVTSAQLVAITMLWFELLLLSAIGFAVSSFAGPLVSAVVSLGAFFAGHLGRDIYELAQKADHLPLRLLGKGIYYVLPQLERLNYRAQATYEISTPMVELLPSVGYALAYSAVMLTIAVLIFERRDFK